MLCYNVHNREQIIKDVCDAFYALYICVLSFVREVFICLAYETKECSLSDYLETIKFLRRQNDIIGWEQNGKIVTQADG